MCWKYLYVFLIVQLGRISCAEYGRENYNGCFEKWLSGYRLAAGRPQRTLKSLTLEQCQRECEKERGCGAIAFGVSGAANGTCELAVRTLRDSRSVNNLTLPYDEVTKSHQYDIYMMSPNCIQRQPLFGSTGSSLVPVGNGVPIDCFYRLMSGKRLAKNHVFRAISVAGLQECQEACIEDGNCRSISYRYMVSGTYVYNVANCELSPFYIVHYEDSNRQKFDFLDDYDYDYFQREPHCKTTSRLGSFGVCAVIARRGAKLGPKLIKSTHHTSTATQCEFLCQTASRFRCRAFSLRHTTRGRDPFRDNRDSGYESVCTLYDVDISRLSQYDIVGDPDFDLYELGRLMGAECVLHDQYLNRRPPTGTQYIPPPYEPERRDHRYPFPSGGSHGQIYDRGYDRERDQSYYDRIDRDRDRDRYYPSNSYLPRIPATTNYYEYHSKRPAGTGTYYPPEQKDGSTFPRPGLTEISGSVTHGIGTSSFIRPTTPPNLPFYDPRREACLVKVKQDVFLAPEGTRAQFPVKSLEECRVECLRSLEVLRFPCRVLSFRLTSSSGGSCQISDFYERDLRSSDFIPARDRYENAVVYSYDEADVLCRRDEGRYGGTRYGTGSTTDYYDRERDRGRERYGNGYGTSTVIDYGRPRPEIDYRPKYPPGYDDRTRVTERDRGQYGSTTHFGHSNEYLNTRYIPPPVVGEQTYTVNGEKCLRQCSQDREAGFYYCVVDARGTWDFCCRPDHYCGYSRGLSTPWCYVGSGPTSQVWRSCNHRLLSESPHPPIAYLHDRPPPKVHALSTTEVVNLSKDNALIKLHKPSSSTTRRESEFANLDGDDDDDVTTTLNKSEMEMEKASSNLNKTEVYFGNLNGNPGGKNETLKIISRQSRRISRKPTFTVVEVKSSTSENENPKR